MKTTRTQALANQRAKAKARQVARIYSLDCLYEVQVNHPRTGRRECVFVAFGLVNSFWARQELETSARATYSKRIQVHETAWVEAARAALGL